MNDTVQDSARGSAKDRLFRDVQAIGRGDDALQTRYTTWQVVRRIWQDSLRPRIAVVAVAGIAMVVTATLTGAVPFVIKKAADDIFVNQSVTMVYTMTVVVIFLTLLKTSSEYLSNVAVSYLGNRFISDLRIRMFERLVRADLRWIEDVHSGRFLSSFLNDAVMIRQAASRTMLAYGESLLKVVVLTVAMFVLDWRLATVFTVCMPFGVILLGRQQRKTQPACQRTPSSPRGRATAPC